MKIARTRSVLALGLVLVALGAGAGGAEAQPAAPPYGYGYPPPPPPPPPPEPKRQGFIIGFSLGGGSMIPDCDDCEGESGVAVDFHLGGMVAPNVALMWDGSAVAHSESDVTLIHAVNAIAAQYWPTRNIWLKGGLGFGRLSVSDDTGETIAESETAVALLGAAGVEVLQTGSFALDLSLRLAAVGYEDVGVTNASLNVGFNWY